jgi:hypothetical protein
MSAAGTRPMTLTSMALLAGERVTRVWPPPSWFRWGLLLSEPRPWLPASAWSPSVVGALTTQNPANKVVVAEGRYLR